MVQQIQAVFEHGVLRPLEPLHFAENEQVSVVVASGAPAELEKRFRALADKWYAETGKLSNVTKKCTHPAYQEIIGLGAGAAHLILRELRDTKADWFWALTAITGENPIAQQDAGDVRKMVEAWLQWAKTKGYDV